MSEFKTIKEQMDAVKAEMEATKSDDRVKNAIKAKVAAKRPAALGRTTSEDPLLFVNGKLNKTDHEYINKNLFVHKGLYNKINAYCRGMDTAIFNYLLHLGLEAIQKEKHYRNVDISDIEINYQ